MSAVETIKNIWKIEDLRNRILTTLLLVAIYRFGTFVVLPGIDPKALTALQEQTRGGLLALLDMFSGGAFSNASIFALGIMPYISASIVMQLMAIAVPSFQKLQREGESGRRKINQWTRYLTVAILLFQGPTYLVNLSVQLRAVGASLPGGIWFTISSAVILAAGSMFILWLGERITDKGIGNGISFIILIGIIARLPHSLFQEFVSRTSEKTGGLVMFLIEMLFLLLVIAGAILLVQGTRKVPVQYAKRIIGNKQYGGVRQYIPLKINAAGVRTGGRAGVIKITVDDIFDPLGASQPDLHIAVELLDKSVGGSIHLHTVDIHNTPHSITDGHLAVKIQGGRIRRPVFHRKRHRQHTVRPAPRYRSCRGKGAGRDGEGEPFSLTI